MVEVSDKLLGGLKKKTLSDFAYEQISSALLSGRLRPGEKLTLRQLSTMLNTSSTPIRDAINQLSVENAIDFAPNRHIRVPELTADQLRELRDIRVLLEGSAVEIAARFMTPKMINELREHDNCIRINRDAGNISAAVEGIYHFHFAIYEASARQHLLKLIRGLWLRTAPYRSLLFPDYSRLERGNLRTMIIGALEQNDGVSARMFMQADTTGAMNFIVEQVELAAKSQKPGAGG